MSSMEIYEGNTVRAFHPAMFGVVRTGTVRKVGWRWIHVDFGVIYGGTFKVARRDIVSVTK